MVARQHGRHDPDPGDGPAVRASDEESGRLRRLELDLQGLSRCQHIARDLDRRDHRSGSVGPEDDPVRLVERLARDLEPEIALRIGPSLASDEPLAALEAGILPERVEDLTVRLEREIAVEEEDLGAAGRRSIGGDDRAGQRGRPGQSFLRLIPVGFRSHSFTRAGRFPGWGLADQPGQPHAERGEEQQGRRDRRDLLHDHRLRSFRQGQHICRGRSSRDLPPNGHHFANLGRRGVRERTNRQERHRRAEPSADESVVEPSSSPGEPALDRADRPAELPGGFLATLAFEVAEHDRLPEAAGESPELLVDDPRQIGAGLGRGR